MDEDQRDQLFCLGGIVLVVLSIIGFVWEIGIIMRWW